MIDPATGIPEVGPDETLARYILHIPKNPNHANIGGWPMDKPAQKIIALEIAATAVFLARA
ncbi:MAG: hypothetical protein WD847_11520 [Pirellulales bacterium]